MASKKNTYSQETLQRYKNAQENSPADIFNSSDLVGSIMTLEEGRALKSEQKYRKEKADYQSKLDALNNNVRTDSVTRLSEDEETIPKEVSKKVDLSYTDEVEKKIGKAPKREVPVARTSMPKEFEGDFNYWLFTEKNNPFNSGKDSFVRDTYAAVREGAATGRLEEEKGWQSKVVLPSLSAVEEMETARQDPEARKLFYYIETGLKYGWKTANERMGISHSYIKRDKASFGERIDLDPDGYLKPSEVPEEIVEAWNKYQPIHKYYNLAKNNWSNTPEDKKWNSLHNISNFLAGKKNTLDRQGNVTGEESVGRSGDMESLSDKLYKWYYGKDKLGKTDGAYHELPSVSEIIATPIEELISDEIQNGTFNSIKQRIKRDQAASMSNIKRYQEDIDETKDPSAYYKKKEEEGTNLLFTMPGSIALSYSDIGTTLGLSVIDNAAKPIIMNIATKSPITAVAAGLGLTAMNIWSILYQRTRETNTEFSQYYNEKYDEKFKASHGGKSIDQLDIKDIFNTLEDSPEKSEFTNEIEKEGSLSEASKIRFRLYLQAGRLKSNDKSFVEAARYAEVGSEEYYKKQMANSYSDGAQILLNTSIFGKFASKLGGTMFKSASKLIPAGTMLGRVTEEVIEKVGSAVVNTRNMYKASVVGRAMGTTVAKVTAPLVKTAFLEAGEEGGQVVTGRDYVYNTQSGDNTYTGAAIDGFKATVSGYRQYVMGSDHPEHTPTSEIRRNMEAGAYQALFMGAGGAKHAYNKARDEKRAKKASDFIDGVIASQLESGVLMDKARTFVDMSTRKSQREVIARMRELTKNPPAGTTKEELEDAINLAQKTYAVASNKKVLRALGGEQYYGSERHKDIVAMAIDHASEIEYARATVKEADTAIDSKLQETIENDNTFKSFIDAYNSASETGPLSIEVQKQIYKLAAEIRSMDNLRQYLRNKDLDKNEGKTKEEIQKEEDELVLKLDDSNLLERGLNIAQMNKKSQLYKILEVNGLTDKERNEYGRDEYAIQSLLENIENDSSLIDELETKGISEAGILQDKTILNLILGNRYQEHGDGTATSHILKEKNHDRIINKLLDDYNLAREKDKKEDDEAEKAKKDKDEATIAAETAVEPILSPVEALSTKSNPIAPEENTEPEIAPEVPLEMPEVTVPTIEELENTEDDGGLQASIDAAKAEADRIANEEKLVEEAPIIPTVNKTPSGEVVEAPNHAKPAEDVPLVDTQSGHAIIRTLTYNGTDESIDEVRGTRSGKDLDTMMNSENPLADCSFEIVVEDYDKKDANQLGARQNATISVYITKGGDGPFTGRYRATVQKDLLISDKFKKDLNRLRNEIIDAYNYAEANGLMISPSSLLLGQGMIKNRIDVAASEAAGITIHEQRNIGDIIGFNLPSKNGNIVWSSVGRNTIKLEIAKGPNDDMIKMDPSENAVGRTRMDNTGSVLINVIGPINGSQVPIKCNKVKMSNQDESLIDLIYYLAVEKGMSTIDRLFIGKDGVTHISDGNKALGMNSRQLLNLIVYAGHGTKIDKLNAHDKTAYYMAAKQFYVDDAGGYYAIHFGEESLPLAGMTEEGKQRIKSYIKSNLTWVVNKSHIEFTDDQHISRDVMTREVIGGIFELLKNGEKSVKLADGFEFTQDDMNLTWLAWLLKNGKIKSDVDDNIFNTPFLKLGPIEVGTPAVTATTITNGGTVVVLSTESKTSKSYNGLTKEEVKQRLELLREKSLVVDPNDSSRYIDLNQGESVENADTWDRVTSLKGEKVNIKGDSADRGTLIDSLLRDFIKGSINNIAELKTAYEAGRTDLIARYMKNRADSIAAGRKVDKRPSPMRPFSDSFLSDLFTIFEDIKKATVGLELISDIPTFWGEIQGKKIAGSIDLMGIADNGAVYIIDLKTATSNRRDPNNRFFETYRDGDAIQQSAYAELLRQRTGITVRSLAILPLEISSSDDNLSYDHIKSNKDEAGNMTMKVTPVESIFDPKASPAATSNTVEAPKKKRKSIKDKIAEDNNRKIDDIVGAPALIRNEIKRRIDVQNARTWLFKVLGIKENELDILENIISIGGDRIAMGLMLEDSIKLWVGAIEGTEYHEAFHRVSLLLLTRQERHSMYRVARENNKSLANATNKQVEEFLAEKFRAYMLKKNSKDTFKIKSLFRKIKMTIQKLIGLKPSSLDKLFSNIENGVYIDIPVNEESLSDFRREYSNGAASIFGKYGFKQIKSNSEFESIVGGLTYLLKQDIGNSIYNNVNKISFDSLESSLSDSIEIAEEDGDLKTAALYKEILDKLDTVFIPRIKEKLVQDSISEEEQEKEELYAEANQISLETAAHTKASNETSQITKINKDVQLFIRMIPESYIEDGYLKLKINDRSGLPAFVPFLKSWANLKKSLYNCRTVESMMLKIAKLSKNDPFYLSVLDGLKEKNSDDFNGLFWRDMIAHKNEYINVGYSDKRAAKGETHSSFNISDSELTNARRLYPTKWGSALYENSELYVRNADGTRAFNEDKAKEIIAQFKSRIMDPFISRKSIGVGQEHKVVVYGDMANDFSNTGELNLYNQEDRLFIIKEIVSVLNTMGIGIDDRTLLYMLEDSDENSEKSMQSLIRFVTNLNVTSGAPTLFTDVLQSLIDNKGRVFKKANKKDAFTELFVRDIYSGVRMIEQLAIAYQKSHPSNDEISMLNVDGNKYYEMSDHNYLTDQIEDINSDPHTIPDLMDADYVSGEMVDDFTNSGVEVKVPAGSLILSQLIKGIAKRLDIKTFVKLYNTDASDKGRGYTKISPAEDFLVKMAMYTKDFIVGPTMADKGSFLVISGAKLIHENVDVKVSISETGRKTNMAFGNGALSQLRGYMKAEVMAIKKAGVEFYKNEANKFDLVSTYHYGGTDLNTGNKLSGDHGNGMRFRHFGDILILPAERLTPLSVNEYIDDMTKTSGKAGFDTAVKYIESIINDEARIKRILNRSLESTLVSKELTRATELGIIKYDGVDSSSIENVGLDKARYNELVDKYSMSPNKIDQNTKRPIIGYEAAAVVFDMLADNLVNSIISTIEFEKLISKDPAFYSSPDDKIKRLSSILSTGRKLRTDWPTNSFMHGRTTFNVAEINDNKLISQSFDKLKALFISHEINRELIRNNKPAIDNLEALVLNNLIGDDEDMNSELSELNKNNKQEFMKGSANALPYYDAYGAGKNGFGNINVTDGGALISPEMYKEILKMTTGWSKEQEEAYNTIEGEDQSWLNDDIRYTKAMALVMSPLKMIYFGDNFDKQRNLNIPKLDKMAMFPLFRIFANGDLAPMYERMNTRDASLEKIHMIATKKVVKVNNNNPIDYHTDKDNTQVNDLSKLSVEQQQYRYLRHQLPTDPHEAHSQSLGTQVVKGALANIKKSNTYVNFNDGVNDGITGEKLLQEVTLCINRLSDIGMASIEKELGVKLGENGEYEINSEALYQLLANDAINSGMPRDVSDALMAYSKNNKFSLQSLMDNAWVETRIVSMIGKKVVDIKMRGGMYIQMSPFGLKSIDAQNLNKGVISDEEFKAKNKGRFNINNGLPLNMKADDGSMECAISINAFLDVLPKELRRASFKKQEKWLIDNNIVGLNSNPAAMGYRIPTQGLSSISALKIVALIPSNIGDTIILPGEFTAQTGSDFDIDKLYIAMYNYDSVNIGGAVSKEEEAQIRLGFNNWINGPIGKGEFKGRTRKDVYIERGITKETDLYANYLKDTGEVYKFVKSTLEFVHNKKASKKTEFIHSADGTDSYLSNSDKAIQNRLLDLYMAALTDPSSMAETRGPLDVPVVKLKVDILSDIDELSGKSNDAYEFKLASPSFQSSKKEEYIGGKAGIPPFALNAAHHSLAQIAELEFNNLYIMNKLGLSSLHKDYGQDGMRISDWLSVMITANVDVAKDPYIMRLNVNSATYAMTNLLLRTGFGKNTFYFLSQQSIKDLASEILKQSGEYNQESISRSRVASNAMMTILNSYAVAARSLVTDEAQTAKLNEIIGGFDGHSENTAHEKMLDLEFLRANLSNKNKDFNWYYNQLLALSAYDKMSGIARSLEELVKASQVDNKKYGLSYSSMHIFDKNIARIINNENSVFKNVSALFSKTFLGHKMGNMIGLSKKIMSNMFFRTTEAGVEFNDYVIDLLGKSNYIAENTIRDITGATDAVLKSKFFIEMARQNGVSIKGMFFDDHSGVNTTMARRLYDIQLKVKEGAPGFEYMEDNSLINAMNAEISSVIDETSYERPSIIKLNIDANASSDIVTDIKMAWSDMIESSNPILKKFAEDLILYQFFTSGENSSFNLIKLAEDDRKSIGLTKFIDAELVRIKNSGSLFEDNDRAAFDIIKSRWYNDEIVPTVQLFTKNEQKFSSYAGDAIGNTEFPSLYSGSGYNKSNPDRFKSIVIGLKQYPTVTGPWIEHPMYTPYIKTKMNNDGPFADYILYEYIGNTTINVGYGDKEKLRVVPVYAAVNKTGLKSNGTMIVEPGLENTFIPSNMHPKYISPEFYKDRESFMKLVKVMHLLGTGSSEEDEFINSIHSYGFTPVSQVMAGIKNTIDYENITTEEIMSKLGYSEDNNSEVIPVKINGWARHSNNGYEVSSKGDSRFSAFYARIKAEGNRSIEEIYQVDVKGYDIIKDGKGKPPLNDISRNEQYIQYKELWIQWAGENPTEMQDLANKANGKTLTDMFANTDINQARALSEILNEFDYNIETPSVSDEAENNLSEDELETLYEAIDNKKNRIDMLKGILGLYDKDSEQYISTTEDLNKATSELSDLENSLTKKPAATSEITSMSEITNHSGGAYGADTDWDVIGREYGVTNHNHYRDENNTGLSKRLTTNKVNPSILNDDQLKEGYAELERITGNRYERTLSNNLKARNYYQVKNADAIFAIASGMADKNGKAVAEYRPEGVTGGTNTAVQMAIAAGKPVYVFSSGSFSWYRWNGEYFDLTTTPTLTKNFAGIGTRDTENYNIKNSEGKWSPREDYMGDYRAEKTRQAIRDVYEKTLASINDSNGIITSNTKEEAIRNSIGIGVRSIDTMNKINKTMMGNNKEMYMSVEDFNNMHDEDWNKLVECYG